ncbi:uncharacterized protein LOC122256675 isoform X2 [Penaeus japonicus]|uniref:uncharacterized protein LOC122256675 isoform X2 n=1 Tax=Penaeus japonicus TaxID=27405 RepID=UPI001C70C731|nr:uncharacterized protein LOC122256675 isoform X2 [Penaeus japonicus]
MSFTLEEAVLFLLENARHRPRDLNKARLKQAVATVEKAASDGLTNETITSLATKIIFAGSYDVAVRRKLLYSLVPQTGDFPYKIIPIAVSTITCVPMSSAWQHAVLAWLGGLLEYGIINSGNRYIHLCYTSILNLMQHLNLCGLACKILQNITIREDVTKNRVLFLVMLKDKPGFHNSTCHLLKLYQLFRPDLVVGHLTYKRTAPITPKKLAESLMAARTRLQEGLETLVQDSDSVWAEQIRAEKANPYDRPTAVPQVNNNVYAEKLEEKKEKMIFVSQYRKFPEIVKGMQDCEKWQWPNNSATHLSNPIIIPLFRPHQQHVLVGITNWLELALRTEVVEGLGTTNKERQKKLLLAAHSLVRCTGTLVPVVNHFLTEFLTKWDESSHFKQVISLLETTTFTSPEFISETFLRTVARLLSGRTLVTWCLVIAAVAKTACAWAIVAQEENLQKEKKPYHDWPQEVVSCNAIVGLWFLMVRMERLFLSALLDFKYHPMVLHQILDFYVKVNMYIEVLELPAFFAPPALLTLAILVKGDISSTHRLGGLLARIKVWVERVQQNKSTGAEEDIRQECLSLADVANQSILFFTSALHSSKAFGSGWRKVLQQFYPFEALEDLMNKDSIRCSAAVYSALPYIPFYAKEVVEYEDELDQKTRGDLRDHVIEELSSTGLTGIEECLKTYKKI